MDSLIPKWLRVWNSICLIMFIIYVIVVLVIYFVGDVKELSDIVDILKDVGISVVSAGVTGFIVTYFRFRKLPRNLESAVDKFDRLQEHLNPDTKSLEFQHNNLSNEHNDIKNRIDRTYTKVGDLTADIRVNQESQKAKYELLDNSNKAIVDSIEKLNGLSYQLQQLNEQNVQLKREIDNLKEQNIQLKSRTKHKEYER